ncbi:MAG: site-specific integrase [Bacteroidales bacterium]|nr:site-specific integrase [Bacteroidales bacterium]
MATPFIDFRPAQVMRNKEVYVSYYVLDPSSDSLKRMRIRCNRIKGRREQARYAARLCAEVNRRLYNGWNPLTGGDDTGPRKKVTIVEAASNYVRQKGKDLRKDTLRSYKSKLSYFTGWCERMGIAGWLCGRFTAAHAAGILDEYGRGHSAYSFNSMLQYLKGMFGAFVSAGHAAYNPFAAFKGRRREVKHRVTIPKQERRRILNYFHKRGMSGYVTMIRLCFRYLVRPKEILMLRMCDIDFDTGILHIPPEVSKNHSERTIALGHDVMRYFRELQRRGLPSGTYIFSTDFKPGARPYTTKNLFAVWQRMRESLSMPESYHFYSLKDTGITEMLESGMPSKFVKDLAGHHSLSMTERYTHVSDARRILAANRVRF